MFMKILCSWIGCYLIGISGLAQEIPDLTDSLRVLGTPAAVRYFRPEQAYARNVWDLDFRHGQLWIASGNSSNLGPSSNAGPVPVLSYNLANNTFSEEALLDEEQIDQFLWLNDTLFIAGHDAHQESWDFGNYYYYEAGEWHKQRKLPGGLHVYDLAHFQGDYYAALGTTGRTPSIFRAENRQGPWQEVPAANSYRKYELFSFQNQLYAFSWIEFQAGDLKKYLLNDEVFGKYSLPVTEGFFAPALVLSDDRMTLREDLRGKVLFPDTPVAEEHPVGKLIRPAVFNQRLYYIGGVAWNDHQTQPFGLYVCRSLEEGQVDIQRIQPASKGDQAWPFPEFPGTLFSTRNICMCFGRYAKKISTTSWSAGLARTTASRICSASTTLRSLALSRLMRSCSTLAWVQGSGQVLNIRSGRYGRKRERSLQYLFRQDYSMKRHVFRIRHKKAGNE